MTKAKVAAILAQKVGLTHRQSVQALDVFLKAVKDALERGEKVSLVGFGTFYLKTRDARNGRNPRTGAAIAIPPKSIATFKPGKALRETINSLPTEDSTKL